MKRRFFGHEVIQASAMDCGPAALRCLLEGFVTPAELVLRAAGRMIPVQRTEHIP